MVELIHIVTSFCIVVIILLSLKILINSIAIDLRTKIISKNLRTNQADPKIVLFVKKECILTYLSKGLKRKASVPSRAPCLCS